MEVSKKDVKEEIVIQAKQIGINPVLALGIFEKESGFNPRALNPKTSGAMGIAQLMPGTARQYGVKDPYNYKENIHAGLRLIKDLVNKVGDDSYTVLKRYGGFVTKDPMDYIVGVWNNALKYINLEFSIVLTKQDLEMLQIK